MINKKYFTKYLPVEGEIKEGDKGVMLLKNNIPAPHKLFLCSRDIQVGDVVWGNYPTKDGFMDMPNEQSVKIHAITHPEHHYKVIGEISPEATWVKEGEISNDLLEFNGPERDPEEWDKESWGQLVVYGKYCDPPCPFVKIKGPCGHFH